MPALECNNRPVYSQFGEAQGYILFQPTGFSSWWIGDTDDWTDGVPDCEAAGQIKSNGNGGECPLSPDAAGCVGLWKENTGCEETWCDAPQLAVST